MKAVEQDHRHEAKNGKSLKLRESTFYTRPTCGGLPKFQEFFSRCFVSTVLFYVIQMLQAPDRGQHMHLPKNASRPLTKETTAQATTSIRGSSGQKDRTSTTEGP